MKNFLSINDLSREDIENLVNLALKLKKNREVRRNDLEGKHIVLIFEKPSLRTRLSFEVAIRELGGNHYFLGQGEVGLGKREAIKDIARVISRYGQGVVLRTFGHQTLIEFADNSQVPVINALTDLEHPCQVMSDILTIYEKVGRLDGFKLVYIGDGNNVCNSLVQLATKLDFQLAVATPSGYEPSEKFLQDGLSRGNIKLYEEPQEAVQGADFIYTDVWTSMGWEGEREERKEKFKKFQVNSQLLKNVNRKYYVMHCLPAHRGEEITDEVIDSPNSIVIDQAENRLHMHKAILLYLFS